MDRDAEDLDRDRGVVTPRDRKYLTGVLEAEGQRERNIRMKIRERAVNGLRDFILLVEEMSIRDMEQVLDTLDDDEVEAYLASLKFSAEYVEHYHMESTRREDLINAYRGADREEDDTGEGGEGLNTSDSANTDPK